MKFKESAYFVGQDNNAESGPFTLREMRRKAAAGELSGATPVRRSDQEGWTTAADLTELGVRDHVTGSVHDRDRALADRATSEMEASYYRRKTLGAAGWFAWIAAMSLLNALFAAGGIGKGFAIGLQLNLAVNEAAFHSGPAGMPAAVTINLLLTVLFLLCAYGAWYGRYWLFMPGMFLYLGDTLLAVWLQAWIPAAVHVVALLFMVGGFLALMERHAVRPGILNGLGWTGLVVLPVALGMGALWLFTPRFEVLPRAAWIDQPPAEWPQFVLTHAATFKGHSGLNGASAALVELPDGTIAAITARHLLGDAGGVEPRLPLKEIDAAIEQWRLYPRHDPAAIVDVTGLHGDPEAYRGDTVVLRLNPAQLSRLPSTPLKLRQRTVAKGENFFAFGVPYGSDTARQEVFQGEVVEVLDELLICQLKKGGAFEGFSGAPVVDADGNFIGIVTGAAIGGTQGGLTTRFVAHGPSELAAVLALATPATSKVVAAPPAAPPPTR